MLSLFCKHENLTRRGSRKFMTFLFIIIPPSPLTAVYDSRDRIPPSANSLPDLVGPDPQCGGAAHWQTCKSINRVCADDRGFLASGGSGTDRGGGWPRYGPTIECMSAYLNMCMHVCVWLQQHQLQVPLQQCGLCALEIGQGGTRLVSFTFHPRFLLQARSDRVAAIFYTQVATF